MAEVLSNVSALVFGFWVFFHLSALQNVLAGHGNWRTQVRKMPRNLLLFWSLFAVFRLILFIWPVPIWSLFIPEPFGTVLFFVAGIICSLLWVLARRDGGVSSSGSRSQPTVSRAPGPTAQSAPPQAADAAPTCPKCGVPMVLRTAKQGKYQGKQFYGCQNFPNCREIVSL